MLDTELLTKSQLAERMHLTVRGVENLMKNGRIPVIRLSSRCVRFSWPKVEQHLEKFTVKAVGSKKK